MGKMKFQKRWIVKSRNGDMELGCDALFNPKKVVFLERFKFLASVIFPDILARRRGEQLFSLNLTACSNSPVSTTTYPLYDPDHHFGPFWDRSPFWPFLGPRKVIVV